MLHGILVDLVPFGKTYDHKMVDWDNNESAFWSSMGDRPIIARAAFERETAEWRSRDREDTGVGFGIRAKDGTPLGYMGVNHVWPHHRLGVLGAVIGEPDYWGGGYGTDALLLLIDYAFDTLDLRRVFLSTMSLNARVLRQMEKVGLRREAQRRHGAHAGQDYPDEVVFGMLRAEWPGRAALVASLKLAEHAATSQT